MALRFYGDCIVIADCSKLGDTYNQALELTDLDRAMRRLNGASKQQEDRAKTDIKALIEFRARILNGEKLGIFWRQYIGHAVVPDKVNNKWPIIYIGRYVSW
jgi:hypothetical protein